MYPLRNFKEFRSIQYKIQLVRRFIAQIANMVSPFTHSLKKDEKFVWGL